MLLRNFIALMLLLTSLSACRQSKNIYSASQLETISNEFGLAKGKTFKLDAGYLPYLFSLDSLKHGEEIKNHYQPIQACYYNKNGQLVSFHINCYAGIGIEEDGDLNWNQQHAFDAFVPKTVAPPDSILPLSKHLSFLKTFNNKGIDTAGFSEYDYTIIIHWGKNWRPTDCQNLFAIVKKNAALAPGKKINILYVNNDNTR